MKKRKNKSVEKPEDEGRNEKEWNEKERNEEEKSASKVELRWVGPGTVEVWRRRPGP